MPQVETWSGELLVLNDSDMQGFFLRLESTLLLSGKLQFACYARSRMFFLRVAFEAVKLLN